MTYADAAKKPGDILDCARLATTIAEALTSILIDQTGPPTVEGIITAATKAVERNYKSSVTESYVLKQVNKTRAQVLQSHHTGASLIQEGDISDNVTDNSASKPQKGRHKAK